MKLFIKRSLLFLIIPPVVMISYYNILNQYYNNKEAENSIFIWGDSQAVRGIDLEALKMQTGMQTYTAAKLGAGVYDFLVFAHSVPKKAQVIVSVSKPAQARSKETDRNMSGISVNALLQLFYHNYTVDELYEIVKKNIKPEHLFVTTSELYPHNDTLILTESIALFEDIYHEIPDYIDDKQAIFLSGFKTLKNKNCNVILVEFPYHHILKNIESKSEIRHETENFKNEVLKFFKITEIDTIKLDASRSVMYDLTHLNQLGATIVSRRIADGIVNRKQAMFYDVTLINE